MAEPPIRQAFDSRKESVILEIQRYYQRQTQAVPMVLKSQQLTTPPRAAVNRLDRKHTDGCRTPVKAAMTGDLLRSDLLWRDRFRGGAQSTQILHRARRVPG